MGNAMGLMFLISAAGWGFTGVKSHVFSLMLQVEIHCGFMCCIYRYGCYIYLISNAIFRKLCQRC